MSPKVSVIMPVYNAEPYLSEAVESILNQSFRDFEFIIIDDGSTDRSSSILEQYQQLDNRIRIYRQENQGVTVALNRGLALAQGEYIARMDADDISLPERLAKQVAFMDTHPEIGVSSTWYRTIGSTKDSLIRPPVSHSLIYAGLLFCSQLCHPSMILRRDISADLLYDPSYKHAQDYELWVRISDRVMFANIPEFLLLYRSSPEQVTQRYRAVQLETQKRIWHNQLSQLGITPSEDELEIHKAMYLGLFDMSQESANATGAWLRKIMKANQRAKVYSQVALWRAASARWNLICKCAIKQLKWWGFPMLLFSPLLLLLYIF